jgi:serine/threonine protein kinase
MRYFPGGSLASRLEERGPLGDSEIRRIVRHVTSTIGAAHERDVVHRDLKPANILMSESDAPYVSDFGSSRLLTQLSAHSSGLPAFTPAYAAPQVFDGQPPTPADDIYSVGALAYALHTGHAPFCSPQAPVTLLQIMHRAATTEIDGFRPDCSPELRHAITQAMAKSPSERPSSAAALTELFDPPVDLRKSSGTSWVPQPGDALDTQLTIPTAPRRQVQVNVVADDPYAVVAEESPGPARAPGARQGHVFTAPPPPQFSVAPPAPVAEHAPASSARPAPPPGWANTTIDGRSASRSGFSAALQWLVAVVGFVLAFGAAFLVVSALL